MMRAKSKHDVTIASDGSIRYDGRVVALALLSASIEKSRRVENRVTRITPAADAPLGRVALVLSRFNQAKEQKYLVAGTEAYSEVFVEKALNYSEKQKIAFRDSSSISRRFPFRVSGRAGPVRSCSITFSGVRMGSDDLRQYAYLAIDAYMKRSGIDRAVWTAGDFPTAVVAGRADTAWMCVAGALYNLQIVGIPTVDLVLDREG